MADKPVTLKRVLDTSGNVDTLHPTTTWEQVENKPSTFTPTSHEHSISDITDIGSASVNYATTAGSVTTADSVAYTTYAYNKFTAVQSSGDLGPWTGGWATHLIGSHGDGSTYYNQTLTLPFWGAPRYSRKEDGVNKGPFKFWTEENDGSGSGLDADLLDGLHSTDLLKYSEGGTIDVNSTTLGSQLYAGSVSSWSNPGPTGHNGAALLSINTHSGGYYSQLWFDTDRDDLYHRTINAGTDIRTWRKVMHEGNIGSKALLLTGGSVTGKIDVAGTDTNGSYYNAPIEVREYNRQTTNVTGNQYAPYIGFHWGGRTQGRLGLTEAGNLAWSTAGSGDGYQNIIHTGNISSSAVTLTNNSTLNSDTRNTRGVTRLYRRDDNSDYSVQTNWTGEYWQLQGYVADTYHAPVRVGYADIAGDVYSWAKASTKPTYTKSEVGLGNVDNTADANKSVNYATTAGAMTYTGIGNVPAYSFIGNNSGYTGTATAVSGNVALALMGVNSTAAELNVLDGITASTTELNYTDGVTSNIQTQLNGKADSTSVPVTSYKNTATATSSTSPVSVHTTGTLLANSYYQIQIDGMWSKTATTNASAPIITFVPSNTTGTPTWNGTFMWANTATATAYTIENNSVNLSLTTTAIGFQPTNTTAAVGLSYWGMNGLIYTGTANKTLTFYVYASIAPNSGTISLEKISVVATKVG